MKYLVTKYNGCKTVSYKVHYKVVQLVDDPHVQQLTYVFLAVSCISIYATLVR